LVFEACSAMLDDGSSHVTWESERFWQFERFASAPAVIAGDGRAITYDQLQVWADQLAAPLPARSLVGIVCHRCPAAVAAYLGCLRRGIVPLLLDRELPKPQVTELVQRFRLAAVWDPLETESFASELPPPAWAATDQSSPPLHPELGLLLTTSGSTGQPRCVRLSYENLQSNASAIRSALQLTFADQSLLSLPWSSAYGLSVLHSHWAAGGAVVLGQHSPVQREFWELFRQTSATNMAGVPVTFEQLARLRFNRMSLPSLRLLTQAGGKLGSELVQQFAGWGEAMGFRFVVMYGQTEATARMAFLRPEAAAQKPSSIGRAIPGGHLHVLNEEGRAVTEPMSEGELHYAGPNVMLGYADAAADLALGSTVTQPMATGDLGYFDADGDYYVTGRKARFVKPEGKRIHLDAVEALLARWGYHGLAAGDDSRMHIAVVPAEADLVPAQLQQRLAEELRIHHQWIEVRLWSQIPRLPSGKVNYPALAAPSGGNAGP